MRKTYKIIFAKNEVLACIETSSGIPGGGDVHIERHHGAPIYALVQAEDAARAANIARQLAGDGAVSSRAGDPAQG